MSFMAYSVFVICMTLITLFSIKKFHKGKKVIILIYVISNFLYLLWRGLFTIPESGLLSIALGLILFGSEIVGYLQSLVFYSIVWKPMNRRVITTEFMEKKPTVDIFIATYNEPLNVLRKVVASCTYLKYPKELVQIYICDDGKREEIKELAKEFQVHYLTRTDNVHAKAGNLNHALTQSNGEIVVTLDADMVVKSSFLERTVGYFSNPKVAFVQTPQAFYNSDIFQYNLFAENKIPNEQDFFMRTLQSGRDRYNSIVYVGTNTLFRRSALEEVGGFATGVITEDMATGMLLQAKYKSVFINEVLARGLSVESWEDLIKQRDRWCRGNIQCAKKWNPLTHPGLSLMQRIIYTDGIFYWFFGLFKMIYIVVPLFFLIFGVYSLNATIQEVVKFWLPAYISSQVAFNVIANEKRSVIWTHIYETAMAPYLAISATLEMFFSKQFKFKVTPKGITNQERTFKWKVVTPHIVLLALSIIAYVQAGRYLGEANNETEMIVINLFWVTYNLIGIVTSILIAFERPRFRHYERFPVNLNGQLNSSIECKVVDMSETGVRIQAFRFQDFKPIKDGEFILSIKNLQLKTKVVWAIEKNKVIEAGLNFIDLQTEQYREVVKILFDNENYFYDFEHTHNGILSILLSFLKNTKRKPKPYKKRKISSNILPSRQLSS